MRIHHDTRVLQPSAVHGLLLCGAVWVVAHSERENAHRTFQSFLKAHGPGHRLGLLAYRLWRLLEGRLPPELVNEIVASAAAFDDACVIPIDEIAPRKKVAALVDCLESFCGTGGLNRVEPLGCKQLRKFAEQLRSILPSLYTVSGNGTVRLTQTSACMSYQRLQKCLAELVDALSNAGVTVCAASFRTCAVRLGTTPDRKGLEPLKDVLLNIERTLAHWLRRV